MAEVVYIAASMRAPVVVALGNRALSGPINIHCDHSDSMLIRDWMIRSSSRTRGGVRCDAARDAAAEHPDVLLPVFVCHLDGFTITHYDLWRSSATSRSAGSSARTTCPILSSTRASRPRKDRSRCRTTTSSLRRSQACDSRRGLECSSSLRRARGAHWSTLRAAGVPAGRCRTRARADGLVRRNGQGRRRRAARARQPVGLLRIGAFRPFPADAVREALHSPRCRGPRSRRLAGRLPTAPRRSRRSDSRRADAATEHRPRAVGISTRKRSRPCSSLSETDRRPRPSTQDCEAVNEPPQDDRPAPGRDTSARQRPLALPGLRRPDGGPDDPGLDRDARGRDQRHGLPGGGDDALPRTPPGTCPGSTSRSRTPQRRRRRRDGVPRPATPWTDPRRAGHLRRNRRRRRHLRHRAAGAFRRPGAWPSVPVCLLRQRGVHEHGVQRSGATPFGAGTTTSPVGLESFGKAQQRKDMTAIAVAHHVPYARPAVPTGST